MIEYPCKRCGGPLLIKSARTGRFPQYHPECRRAVKAERARDRAALLRSHGLCSECKQPLPAK